jgi:hypothetical protein
MVLNAIFKDGVAVPESNAKIPDGTRVEMVVPEKQLGPIVEMTAEEREEFAFWENVSNQGWQKFLDWEREAPE